MKVDLVLQIANLAIAIADQQLDHNVKDDPLPEAALLEIIQKAAQAYRDYTGQPLDPAIIKAEIPATL